MCRYHEHSYPQHFVCFACRRAFKGDFDRTDGDGGRRCPHCARPALAVGHDFSPPRRLARSQWRKLELLVANGVRFDSCGCRGPGPRPATLASARQFLRDRSRAIRPR